MCSSVKDLSAANEAALEERTIPSSHPRILDGHVCRSPMLLRAAATAIVRLYEVGFVTSFYVQVDDLPGLKRQPFMFKCFPEGKN